MPETACQPLTGVLDKKNIHKLTPPKTGLQTRVSINVIDFKVATSMGTS